MKKLLLLLVLISTTTFADEVKIIGRLAHGDLEDFITTAYQYDYRREVICVSASVTRYGGGASTQNKCYKYRSKEKPKFTIENSDQIVHDEIGKLKIPKNEITTFKIIDQSNDIVCYGTLITRRGVSHRLEEDKIPKFVSGASGASLSLDCI